MTRRTRRGFIKKDQVLEKLKRGRDGAIQVRREARIKSDEYRAAGQITQAVDDLVEILTGDRTLFWEKGSAPQQSSKELQKK